MPVKEDGELHAQQARSAVWDLVLEGRGRVQKNSSGKNRTRFQRFYSANLLKSGFIYLFN